jgi:hypothetical protein
MREIRSSGSVRGGVGNDPAYSARRLEDRPWLPIGRIEPVEPGIGVRLQDAGELSQVPLGMLASAVR